ncbi:GNAT family N-acetyltransferase [Microbacterium paludicola]|uniref:GNAT family N-acetyltransferase n=1 Tax=Microbacterium paludicola TaxID=300019 RepID=UPI0038792C7F
MTLSLEPMPAERFDAWRAQTVTRMAALRRESRMRPPTEAAEEAEGILRSRFPEGIASEFQHVLEVRDGGRVVGSAWLEVKPADGQVKGLLYDLRANDPTAALALIEARAAEEGAAELRVDLFVQDAAGWGAIEGRGYLPTNVQMLLEPLPATRASGTVALMPMTAEQYASFEDRLIAEFADDLVREGLWSPEGALAESARQTAEELPDGLATEGQLFFVAHAEGIRQPVGTLWLEVRQRSRGPHVFVMELHVEPSHRRRGFGAAMMRAAEDVARSVGAESIGLHVFGSNDAARSLYRSLGYREAEVLLAKPLRGPAPRST